MFRQEVEMWFKGLQDEICQALEQTDGKGNFKEDAWAREGGGGGRSRVMDGGHIIEKGGVNFSAVHGATPEKILKALNLDEADFFATGVSIVLHPHNPFVPIIHMNVRYFEMDNGVYWFGGGIDLTPHYIDREDARYFHEQLKAVCDRHHPDYYSSFKPWADRYFFLKHRNETRGVGGIFFDHLKATDSISKAERWSFVQDVGKAFVPIYTHFMKQNHNIAFGDQHKQWQYLRRGRYVEFNLVWDKGTRFGLDTNGRTESILMSLPPMASWAYNFTPAPKSREAHTLSLLKQGIDWL